MRFFRFFVLPLLLIATLAAGGWFALYVFTPVSGTEERLVHIPKGAGIRQIKGILGQQGIIRDDVRFLVLMRLLLEIEREHPPHLRAGEFRVPQGMTPLQAVRFLDAAKPIRYKVTVPEGKTMEEVADIFTEKQWVDPTTFLQLCQDKEFIQGLGTQAVSLEGYLFPETYTLVRGEVDERSIITSMVRRFFAVWDEVSSQRQEGAVEWQEKLNQHELLILASIVEKETGATGERDIIAGTACAKKCVFSQTRPPFTASRISTAT